MFDEHFESHQLALHDSPVFRHLVECAGIESDEQAVDERTTLADLLAAGHGERSAINQNEVE